MTFKSILRGVTLGAILVVMTACQTTLSGGPDTRAQKTPLDVVQQTLFESAREAELANNYEQAAAVYGRLFERRYNDPAVLAAFIRNMRYSGRSREITSYVEDKTQHLLGDATVKFEFAKALLSAGRKDESLQVLSKVATLMPNNWQVYSATGVTLDALERYQQASQAYARALQVSPNNPVVLNNLAMSLAMSGKLAEATKTLERAAGIDRQHPHIRQNLALLYAIDGKIERARALAAMDLDLGELETNLSFYRRFEKGPK
ncbi:MAG: tetratricopeptide repeat protein [Magnetovibrio sp.]|nr:tetratricopeptide repeat protein [Magnetovibrio sp.]